MKVNYFHFCVNISQFVDALAQCELSSSRCRFYGKLLKSLMECDEETVDLVRANLLTRLGPEIAMLFQLLQNKPCPSAAVPTGMETRGGWRWSSSPHGYKNQPNLRSRDASNLFGKKRNIGDSS